MLIDQIKPFKKRDGSVEELLVGEDIIFMVFSLAHKVNEQM